jgi:hypothetical protein
MSAWAISAAEFNRLRGTFHLKRGRIVIKQKNRREIAAVELSIFLIQ